MTKKKTRPQYDHLAFNAIYANEMYTIKYVDENYPCDCPCHQGGYCNSFTEDRCCQDNSYSGPALCVGKNFDTKMCVFFSDEFRYYTIHYTDVLKEYDEWQERLDKSQDGTVTLEGSPQIFPVTINSINYACKQAGIKRRNEI